MAEVLRVAVIDIGKTNAKVAVFDLGTMQEIDRLTTPNTVRSGGLYPHFDLDALWKFIVESLFTLAKRHRIDALSVTTHGAACVLLAEDHTLALPMLDYEFAGPQALTAEYEAARPGFDETGSPRLPGGLNLGAQIFWQQQAFPKAFAKVRWIVTYPQYWAFRLSGMLANEATSLGCHTDLWSPKRGDYSSLVDAQGWRKLMPSLRRASDELGPLLPEIAAQTGLPRATPVFCGIHDSNASLYPHLIMHQPPFSVVSTGTWVISMAIGGKQTALDPAHDTLINVNAMGAAVPSGRFMGGREFQLLGGTKVAEPGHDTEKEVLRRRLMHLPSVVADCGPYPSRKAAWLNDTGASPAEKQLATSWYLGLMTAASLGLVGADGPSLVEGPFADNKAFLEMLAAATGREVIASPALSTGTTMGAALLCKRAPKLPMVHALRIAPREALRVYAAEWNEASAAQP